MYKGDDFNGMPNNPLALDSGQYMWQKYRQIASVKSLSMIPPDLAKLMADTGEPDESVLNEIVKFCVLNLETLNNPLSRITDFDERHDAVFDLLRWKDGDLAKKLVMQNHFWFREIELAYFKVINNDLYTAWYSKKMNFHNANALLRSPISDGADAASINARTTIEKNMDTMIKSIQEMEHKLFPDERTRHNISQTSIQNNLYAEKHAEDYQPVRA